LCFDISIFSNQNIDIDIDTDIYVSHRLIELAIEDFTTDANGLFDIRFELELFEFAAFYAFSGLRQKKC
jgi:hypothetical protein